MNLLIIITSSQNTKAAVRKCSLKKLFWKTLLNSEANTRAVVSFWSKSPTQIVFYELWKQRKHYALLTCKKIRLGFNLTLSWGRFLSYRNQSIDLLCKSLDWFLYDRDLLHERANAFIANKEVEYSNFILTENNRKLSIFLRFQDVENGNICQKWINCTVTNLQSTLKNVSKSKNQASTKNL